MEANNDGWEPHSDSHTYRVAIDLMGYESISRFEVLGHVGMLGYCLSTLPSMDKE